MEKSTYTWRTSKFKSRTFWSPTKLQKRKIFFLGLLLIYFFSSCTFLLYLDSRCFSLNDNLFSSIFLYSFSFFFFFLHSLPTNLLYCVIKHWESSKSRPSSTSKIRWRGKIMCEWPLISTTYIMHSWIIKKVHINEVIWFKKCRL